MTFFMSVKDAYPFILPMEFLMGPEQEDPCESGTRTLLVNGDNSNHETKPEPFERVSDFCGFYRDLEDMRDVFTDKTCEKVLAPRNAPSLQGFCFGLGNKYRKEFPTSTSTNFFLDMENTVLKAKDKSIIYMTDHGNIKNMKQGDNVASLAEGDLEKNQLSERLGETIKEKKLKICNCDTCSCDLPPTIFAFDFCYSGGMLDGLLDSNNEQIANVCGLSTSSGSEYGWNHETLAKRLKSLKSGLSGVFKNNYLKWDLNNDGEISLKEWGNYSFVEHKKSVPELTSDRYIDVLYEQLDLDKKSINLDVDESFCDQIQEKDKVENLNLQLQLIKYEDEKNQLIKTVSQVYNKKITHFNPTTIDILKKEEKEADMIMHLYGDISYKFDRMAHSLQPSLLYKLYETELLTLQNKDGALANARKICEKLKDCPTLTRDEFDLKNSKSKKLIKMVEDHCKNEKNSLLCYDFKDYKSEAEISLTDKKTTQDRIATTDKQDVIDQLFKTPLEKINQIKMIASKEKNKKILKKVAEVEEAFKKVEKKTKKSLDKKISNEKVTEIFQKSWTDIADILYSANYKKTEVFGWEIPTPIDMMIHNAHGKKIKTRKAMKIVKELAVKKELIRLGKAEEIKKLEAFEKCEDTPMFTYKK